MESLIFCICRIETGIFEIVDSVVVISLGRTIFDVQGLAMIDAPLLLLLLLLLMLISGCRMLVDHPNQWYAVFLDTGDHTLWYHSWDVHTKSLTLAYRTLHTKASTTRFESRLTLASTRTGHGYLYQKPRNSRSLTSSNPVPVLCDLYSSKLSLPLYLFCQKSLVRSLYWPCWFFSRWLEL